MIDRIGWRYPRRSAWTTPVVCPRHLFKPPSWWVRAIRRTTHRVEQRARRANDPEHYKNLQYLYRHFGTATVLKDDAAWRTAALTLAQASRTVRLRV